MSRLDINIQTELLKEAEMYFKDVKPVSNLSTKEKEGVVVLTQEHISEWLQVFYDDRIMMGTCNEATVKQ